MLFKRANVNPSRRKNQSGSLSCRHLLLLSVKLFDHALAVAQKLLVNINASIHTVKNHVLVLKKSSNIIRQTQSNLFRRAKGKKKQMIRMIFLQIKKIFNICRANKVVFKIVKVTIKRIFKLYHKNRANSLLRIYKKINVTEEKAEGE